MCPFCLGAAASWVAAAGTASLGGIAALLVTARRRLDAGDDPSTDTEEHTS
jgi:hypothetical protein